MQFLVNGGGNSNEKLICYEFTILLILLALILNYDFIKIALDTKYLHCGVIKGQIPDNHTMELNIASQVKHSNVYGLRSNKCSHH